LIVSSFRVLVKVSINTSLTLDSNPYEGFQPQSSRAALSSIEFGQLSAIFCLKSGLYLISNSGIYFLTSVYKVSGEQLKPVILYEVLVDFIGAPKEKLTRTSYNITGFNCSPDTLYTEVKKYIPELEIKYKPDFRQNIADSWPNSIDDKAAREDWGWNPSYGFESSVKDVLIETFTRTRNEDTIKPQFDKYSLMK
jgi:hypothetical protein